MFLLRDAQKSDWPSVKRLAASLVRTGLPLIALYALLSVPLIIFEEHIDGQATWCGRVAIPPTLPFLLLEMLVLGTLAWLLHAKSPIRVTLVFSVYGTLFEILVGGLRELRW